MSNDKEEWLKILNPQQLEAVTHGNGPLLVVAGAGTGKTRTLAYRVAQLASIGIPPERILLLTFTRIAAKEMLKRAGAAIGGGDKVTSQVWGGTFHSFANHILRIYSQAANIPPDFTIIDRTDAEDLLDVIRHEIGYSTKEKRFPRKSTCLAIYSRRVNSNDELEKILSKDFPWCEMWSEDLKILFREYVSRKQKYNVLDYDDLLLYLYFMLQNDKVAESIDKRFDHILVDEYQDTNSIQAGILLGLRRYNNNITVVGDDAQSIYSFRSATVRNMLDFPKQFPGTKIITLEQNYRSIPPILNTTNRIISQARERYTKDLWSQRKGEQRPQLITCFDESHQDKEVIRLILKHYEEGIPLRRQAVLFRAASHSNSLEIALNRNNIPFYKYGGLRFLEMAHIKDLTSFLRILENPRDEIAFFRVLQLLNGIGPATAAAIFQYVQEHGGDCTAIIHFRAPVAARTDLIELGSLFKELNRLGDSDPAVQIDRIRRFYSPHLERLYENPGPRENDLEHLSIIASGYPSRRQFLADLILDPPTSTGDYAGPPTKDDDWLVLSTVHSAKGLEWDVVYVIHAADGCIPADLATGSSEEIEEELRIVYVALTRARDYLYVLWPQRYYGRPFGRTDAHIYAQLSRFINDEVIATMDESLSIDRVNPQESADFNGHRLDIANKIFDIWQ